jgi:formamidase
MPDGSTLHSKALHSVIVSEYTNSVMDPDAPMLGPVQNGGIIIANTAPGFWGPMIIPRLRGGHEVTRPIFVEGAEIGDGVAIRIWDITVTSGSKASGRMRSHAISAAIR